MGMSVRKCPGWQQGSKGDCSKWTFATVILHRRGECGPSAEGRAGYAFPQDAVEEVIATGIKTTWGWRWG